MKIKKTILILFSTFVLTFSALIFDYYNNTKTVFVSLHTVTSYDVQEKFSLYGEVYQKNNVNYLKNSISSPHHIKEGAYAKVKIGKNQYDGYLHNLENEQEDIVAVVSVVSNEKLSGTGEAEVFGQISRDVIMIPREYVFENEEKNTCVMIVRNGYVVERKVTLGTFQNSKGIEIKEGLLPEEKIVINHRSVKTGDRYK